MNLTISQSVIEGDAYGSVCSLVALAASSIEGEAAWYHNTQSLYTGYLHSQTVRFFLQQKSLNSPYRAVTLFIFCGWITEITASSFVNVLSKFDTSAIWADSVGLNGASIFIFNNLSVSMSCNQGWFRISRIPSLVPSLFAGSFSKS